MVESASDYKPKTGSVRAHEEGVHRREIGPCMRFIPMAAAFSVAVFHFFM